MDTRFDPHDPAHGKAFDEAKPLFEAIPPERVLDIRHDIVASIFVALGIVERAKAMRPAIAAEFGEGAAQCVDRIEAAAKACAFANALHLTTLHGEDLEAIAGRLSQLRTILLLEAQALIARGLLPSSGLAELIGGTSYKGLYLDVLQLVALYRREWAGIAGKTGVTVPELDQADALANAFSVSVGESQQSSGGSPTAETRRRAYTHFVRTYSEVRRYATYLRWDLGDADELFPPLGAGRTRKGDEPTADPPGEPAEPPPMPGGPFDPAA